MVIRVVLAVLLSAVILSMALPAADTARSQRAATLVVDEAEQIVSAAERLQRRNDAVRPGVGAATRPVTVRVPAGTRLRIQNGSLTWHDGETGHRVGSDVRLAGDLTLGDGRHRLHLALHQGAEGPVVTVRRFKAEPAATASRVRPSLPGAHLPL